MPSFRLQTLGDLSLRTLPDPSSSDADAEAGRELVGPSKGLAVLALLAATPGHGALRAYLADLLWPDVPPDRRRGSLRQALYYVKHRAGTELLHREGDRLSLRPDRIEVDLWELERAVERERWPEVIRCYGGPFVPEVPGEVSEEFRGRVRSVRSRVASRVATAREMTSTDSDALPDGRAPGDPETDPGGEDGAGGPDPEPPRRHDWVTILAPATVAAAGLGVAALLV